MITKIMMRAIRTVKNSVLFCILTISLVANATEFLVKSVQIEGLRHIARETVLHYLPIQTGQVLNQNQSSRIIKQLYATGFFQNIELKQEANHCLKIKIEEKPIIKKVVVTGQRSVFPKDKLNSLLKTYQLAQGQFFDESSFYAFKTEITTHYTRQGYYAVKLAFSTQPEENHHITLKLHFEEGSPVKVANIQIQGQKSFRESQLLAALPLSRYYFWSTITNTGRYTLELQKASLKALRHFYLDRGFFDFNIEDNHVNLTPNLQAAYWTIQVTEGEIYSVEDFKIEGNTVVEDSKLQKLIKVFPKQRYSRVRIAETEEAIREALGAQGYIYAQINTQPTANSQDKTVRLTMHINPGKRIYIGQINIKNNIKTMDKVLRRMLPPEGGLLSLPALRNAIRQVAMSGLVEGIPDVALAPIKGTDDHIDLNIHVAEKKALSLTLGVGYGNKENGWGLNFGLNQPNILGTGNCLVVNLDHSAGQNLYNLGYETPYYTLDGVGRSMRAYYLKHKPNKNGVRNYLISAYGGELQYKFPLNEQGDTLQTGLDLQHMDVHLPLKEEQSEEVKHFVNQYGTRFTQATLRFSLQRNSLDRLVFPVHGTKHTLSTSLHFSKGDANFLNYYKAQYEGIFYLPLQSLQKAETPEWILKTRLNLGYGSQFTQEGLPFFANYHAGGIYAHGSVRGFEENSLGPKDSKGSPLGGNILLAANLSLIFPHPLESKQIRTSLFLDAGIVRSSMGVTEPNHPRGGTDPGGLRAAVGVSIDCFISILNATVTLNFAKALNPASEDKLDSIQFGFNASF